MINNTFSLISMSKDQKKHKAISLEISTSAKVYQKSLEDYKVSVDSDNPPLHDWSILFLHKLATLKNDHEPHKIATLFTLKTIKRKYQCSTFSLENGIKRDTSLFDGFCSNLKEYGSKYINKFKFPIESQVSKELFKIIFSEIEQWDNSTINSINEVINSDIQKKDYSEVDSKTKVSLNNWQEIYARRDILDDGSKNKLGEFGFEGYPSILVAENDNFICITTVQSSNQHFIDDRVLPIENNLTISFCIFESCKSQNKLLPFYKDISSVFNMYTQFIYGQDLNKNIKNSIGEASEIARYWYTDGLQALNKKQDEFDKSSNSFIFSKSFVDEILVKEIPGVDNIEIYPFDRIFIFKQSTLDNTKKNQIEMHVAEALLKQKSTSEDSLIRERGNFVFEWERDKFEIPDYDIDFNKKIIDYEEFIIEIEKKGNDKVAQLSCKANNEGNTSLKIIPPVDGEQSIESVINEMLYNILTSDVEKKKLLEYEGKHFKNGLCYIYSQGLVLSDLPQFKSLIEAYWKSLELLDDRYINIKGFSEKILQTLDDTKVVLASYKPNNNDGYNKDAFTMLIIANKDIPKTQSELGAEKDDLHTAYKLMVRQQTETAELNREMREKSNSIVLDQLGQAIHNIKGKVLQGIQKLIEDIDLDKEKGELVYKHRDSILHDIEEIKDKFASDINDTTSVIEYIDIRSKFAFENTLLTYKTLIENHVYVLENPSSLYDKIAKLIIESGTKNNSVVYQEMMVENGKLDFYFNNFGLPSFQIPSHNLLREAFHTLLKNATEAVLSSSVENKSISIKSSILSNSSNSASLYIEIVNTTDSLSKARINEINNPELEKVTKGDKVGSTGSGVPKSRQQLQKIFGEDVEILYTMLDKNMILCRFKIPVKLIENSDIYDREEQVDTKAVQKIENADIFYLEDDEVNYSQTLSYFDEEGIAYKHSPSLEGFKQNFKNEKILLTDLNILGKVNSNANITSGYQAIRYFLSQQSEGIIVIISTVSVREIRKELLGKKYDLSDAKIHDTLEDTMKDGHIYIYNRHKIITQNTITDPLAKLFSLDKKESISPFVETALEVYKISKSISHTINETQSNLQAVYQLQEVFNTADRKKLTDTLEEWLGKELKTDLDFLESIANPDEFKTVLIVPLVVDDFKSISPLVLNHFAMRNNICFIILSQTYSDDKLQSKITQVFNTRENMEFKSNGLFSAIRHDINKVDNRELVQNLLIFIHDLDHLTTNDLDQLFIIKDNKKIEKLLKNTYSEYTKVIDEIRLKSIPLGGVSIQNHISSLETLSCLLKLNSEIFMGTIND